MGTSTKRPRGTKAAKPEDRFRAVLAEIGLGREADGLVRAVLRARRASRNLSPTDVLAPHLETMTFRNDDEAERLFDAVQGFWSSIPTRGPRPRAETPRERAEDLLEEALREAGTGDDMTRVESLLHKATEEDPGWWEPHLELADLLLHGLGREGAARIHYGRALEAARRERPKAPDPELDPTAWSWKHVAARPYLRSLEALADYHAEKNEWDKARRLYDRLLHHDDADPMRVRSRLAEARERMGDAAGAMEIYRALASEHGAGEPGVLFGLGRLLIEAGETTEGELLLWRAALVQPWGAAALLDLPLDGKLDPGRLPEIEWIEIGLGYAERATDLWSGDCEARRSLERIFRDPDFLREREEAITTAAALMQAPEGTALDTLRKRMHDLVDPAEIRARRSGKRG